MSRSVAGFGQYDHIEFYLDPTQLIIGLSFHIPFYNDISIQILREFTQFEAMKPSILDSI